MPDLARLADLIPDVLPFTRAALFGLALLLGGIVALTPSPGPHQ